MEGQETMKATLQDLGVTVKSPTPMAVESAKTASKPTKHFPDVRLTSAQIDGLENCKVGQKYRLVFEAEVKGDKSPGEWEMREEGLKATGRIVDFKLVKGSAELMGKGEKKAYRDFEDAAYAGKEGK